MKSTLAYLKVRQERRRKALEKFLFEMVIPDDFDSDDVGTVENYLKTYHVDGALRFAFCDFFELGRWFEDEMEEINFDIVQFVIELRERVEKQERENTEDYREMCRDHAELVKGGAL